MAGLLSDAEVQSFIVRGYHIIPREKLTSVPPDVHQRNYDAIHAYVAANGKPGNNLTPVLADMHGVLRDPAVTGALQSVLGPGCVLHAHRHPHRSPPGRASQDWHKDSYWGHWPARHLLPRYVMLMYYPQTVTAEMGPTAVCAGSQYLIMGGERDVEEVGMGRRVDCTVDAGSLVMIHYDIWHKATENTSDVTRYMFKYQYYRTAEPAAPTWHTTSPEWRLTPEAINGTGNLRPIYHTELEYGYRMVWRWMCGMSSSVMSELSVLPSQDWHQLPGEKTRLSAAFACGALTLNGLDLCRPMVTDTAASETVAREDSFALQATCILSAEPVARAVIHQVIQQLDAVWPKIRASPQTVGPHHLVGMLTVLEAGSKWVADRHIEIVLRYACLRKSETTIVNPHDVQYRALEALGPLGNAHQRLYPISTVISGTLVPAMLRLLEDDTCADLWARSKAAQTLTYVLTAVSTFVWEARGRETFSRVMAKAFTLEHRYLRASCFYLLARLCLDHKCTELRPLLLEEWRRCESRAILDDAQKQKREAIEAGNWTGLDSTDLFMLRWCPMTTRESMF